MERLLDPIKSSKLMRQQLSKDIVSLRYDDPQAIIWWNFTDNLVLNTFGAAHKNTSDFGNRSWYAESLHELQREHRANVQRAKALLESFIDQLELMPPAEAVEVVAEREGFYFSGQTFDAMLRASKLFAAAKTRIVVIDGYIGGELLSLLSVKGQSVHVHILTKPLSAINRQLCKAFQSQHRNLSVRLSDDFHDRFVILDDLEFYHFGASIKDLGKKGFMFSRIEEGIVIDAVRDRFEEVWKTATVDI